MVHRAVAAGLLAAGRDVIDIGLATTPTTQIAVEHLQAGGGDHSHRQSQSRRQWNALKFLSARGEFIDADAGRAVRGAVRGRTATVAPFDRLGVERAEESGADDWHLEQVLEPRSSSTCRRSAARAAHGSRSTAARASAGSTAPRLLRDLGADRGRARLRSERRASRASSSRCPSISAQLGRAVRRERAPISVWRSIPTPIARRSWIARACRSARSTPWRSATSVVLARRPGPVVTNLSTSRMIGRGLRARWSACSIARLVGEAHVVAEMRRAASGGGGEGNGGMILPAAHYGRDGLVAIALIAQAIAEVRDVVARVWPIGCRALVMHKQKTGAAR